MMWKTHFVSAATSSVAKKS